MKPKTQDELHKVLSYTRHPKQLHAIKLTKVGQADAWLTKRRSRWDTTEDRAKAFLWEDEADAKRVHQGHPRVILARWEDGWSTDLVLFEIRERVMVSERGYDSRGRLEEEDPLVCSECGSDEVEQALWVILKTEEINDSEGFGSRGNGGHYCPSEACENDPNEIGLVRRSEYSRGSKVRG